MLTTAAVVSMIASLGYLFLNWRSFQSDARTAGWSRSTQMQMALIWVAIIAGAALIIERFWL